MNLKQALRRTGAPALAQVVGTASLSAAKDILSQDITETMMVDIIIDRLGTQILSNRDLRQNILSVLSAEELNFVHSGETGSGERPTTSDITWGRESTKAKRLLEILGLDERYLPEAVIRMEASETAGPCLAPLLCATNFRFSNKVSGTGGRMFRA